MTKELATTEQTTALATQGASTALSPMQQVGREIALVPGVDEEYQFAMRKLGTIHTGIKVQYQKRDYKTKKPVFKDGQPVMVDSPKAVDHFVLPDHLREDAEFKEKLESMGQNPDKPTRLPIMMMSDDLSVNVIRCCELWGTGAKLKCRATPFHLPGGRVGLRCIRLNPQTLDYEEAVCNQEECADFKSGACAWVTKFRFMLPDQSRLGYWEIITKSDNNKGALARELMDLRKMLQGRIAGVDLALVLTNERTFHPKVTANGKTTRMETRPYLLHIELGKSMRKIMAEGRVGNVIDAEIIHDSYEMDEEPAYTGDGDEFEVGEAPAEPTAQAPEVSDAEFTPQDEPLPTEAPPARATELMDDARKEKLNSCKGLGTALGLNNAQLAAEIAAAGLPVIAPKEMSLDQLQTLYDHLYAKANRKPEDVTDVPLDFDPFAEE